MCIGLSWNLQAFNSKGKTSNMRSKLNKQSCIWEPLSIFNMVFSTPKGKKRNRTIYTGELQTSKRRTGNLFGFSFNYYYYSKKSKLTKSYTIFFGFLKVFQTHKKKARKINLSMDDTMKKCEHRQTEWYVNMNIMSVRTRTPPSLGFWPKLVVNQ